MERPITALLKALEQGPPIPALQKALGQASLHKGMKRPVPALLKALEQVDPIPALPKAPGQDHSFPYGDRPVPALLKALEQSPPIPVLLEALEQGPPIPALPKALGQVSKNAGIGPWYRLKIFRLPTYFFHLPTTLASYFWSLTSFVQMFSSHPHFLSLSLFLNPLPLLFSSSLLKIHHFFSQNFKHKNTTQNHKPYPKQGKSLYLSFLFCIYICC